MRVPLSSVHPPAAPALQARLPLAVKPAARPSRWLLGGRLCTSPGLSPRRCRTTSFGNEELPPIPPLPFFLPRFLAWIFSPSLHGCFSREGDAAPPSLPFPLFCPGSDSDTDRHADARTRSATRRVRPVGGWSRSPPRPPGVGASRRWG